MNEQQIKWASQHDWFIDARDSVVLVAERYAGEPTKYIKFSDFKALKEWAGY